MGTIEGRKNHIALLEACEALWASGKHFELQLIGMARQDTGRDALAKIETLKNAGRSLIYNGVATRNELQSAYQECSFTVYPSLKEGFGLPVLESLDHGKPCICSNEGALGESARSGGCIGLATMDASTIETAIAELLEQSTRLKTLTEEAAGRPFRSWCDYAGELHAWVKTVRRRE